MARHYDEENENIGEREKKDLSPKASEAFEQENENIEQLRGFSRIKLDQE